MAFLLGWLLPASLLLDNWRILEDPNLGRSVTVVGGQHPAADAAGSPLLGWFDGCGHGAGAAGRAERVRAEGLDLIAFKLRMFFGRG